MLIPTAENLWWALNLLLNYTLIYYGLTLEHFFLNVQEQNFLY